MNRVRTPAILFVTVALVGLLLAPPSVRSSPPLPIPSLPVSAELNVSCELTNGLSQWPAQSYNATGTNYTKNVTIIWHKLCATTLFTDLIYEWGDLQSTTANGTTYWTAENLTATGTSYPAVGLWILNWYVLSGPPGNRTWCHGENWEGDVVNNSFTVSPIWNNDNCQVRIGVPMVTFIENGLPTGTTWSITVNGTTSSSASEGIVRVLPNGTYPYVVGNVSGYSAFPSTGVVIMKGSSVGVTINFTPTASPVAPTLLGLPSEVTYVVLGAAVGVGALGVALLEWRGRRRKRSLAEHYGRSP
jgi:hypothetical protein